MPYSKRFVFPLTNKANSQMKNACNRGQKIPEKLDMHEKRQTRRRV